MFASSSAQTKIFLGNLVSHHKTPGLQYVALKNDALFLEYTAGFAEFETGTAMSNQTFFNACSVTKTFTSLAIMQLVEQGKINLSDPVSQFLDDYPFEKDITIQQLLSHTSGLRNPVPLRWAHLHEEEASFNSDAFISEVLKANAKLRHSPGEKICV